MTHIYTSNNNKETHESTSDLFLSLITKNLELTVPLSHIFLFNIGCFFLTLSIMNYEKIKEKCRCVWILNEQMRHISDNISFYSPNVLFPIAIVLA